MQGFFTLSAEATEDLGLEDADNDGSDDESPLDPVPGGESAQPVASSIDNDDDHTSDKEMEESSEPDSELSEEEDEDAGDNDVYLTANIHKSGGITIHAANFNAFAKSLELKRWPVP
jgi:hypothetical protein